MPISRNLSNPSLPIQIDKAPYSMLAINKHHFPEPQPGTYYNQLFNALTRVKASSCLPSRTPV